MYYRRKKLVEVYWDSYLVWAFQPLLLLWRAMLLGVCGVLVWGMLFGLSCRAGKLKVELVPPPLFATNKAVVESGQEPAEEQKGPQEVVEQVIDDDFLSEMLHAGISEESIGVSGNDKVRTEVGAYIKRFLNVAKVEQEKFGIPVSITLGQGLLESRRGQSKLATMSNNHFGIKCFANHKHRKAKCHYAKDEAWMGQQPFRVYQSAWACYRDHSLLIATSKRYKHLPAKYSDTDYQGWAKGIAKAGYASDPKYAQKLIAVIKALGLHRYD